MACNTFGIPYLICGLLGHLRPPCRRLRYTQPCTAEKTHASKIHHSLSTMIVCSVMKEHSCQRSLCLSIPSDPYLPVNYPALLNYSLDENFAPYSHLILHLICQTDMKSSFSRQESNGYFSKMVDFAADICNISSLKGQEPVNTKRPQ